MSFISTPIRYVLGAIFIGSIISVLLDGNGKSESESTFFDKNKGAKYEHYLVHPEKMNVMVRVSSCEESPF